MSDSVFLDTNVLVYLFDGDSPQKRLRARQVLSSAVGAGRVVISTQVLQEFYVTVTRKLGSPLSESDAEVAVDDLSALDVQSVDTALVKAAIATSRAHRLSLWDALIVESARAAGCERLLSEDMNHGQSLAGVRVENPFRLAAGSGSGPG